MLQCLVCIVGGRAVVSAIECHADRNPGVLRSITHFFHHLAALRQSKSTVAVPTHHGAMVAHSFESRSGVDAFSLNAVTYARIMLETP